MRKGSGEGTSQGSLVPAAGVPVFPSSEPRRVKDGMVLEDYITGVPLKRLTISSDGNSRYHTETVCPAVVVE